MNLFTVRRIDHLPAHDYEPEQLALVEELDQTGDFIVIQKAEHDDPEEVELGLGGPCVLRPSGETAYNAVDSYEISPTAITLRFTLEGARDLGLDPLIELPHELSQADIGRLGDVLAAMLEKAPRTG
jgi:hypothetical protein